VGRTSERGTGKAASADARAAADTKPEGEAGPQTALRPRGAGWKCKCQVANKHPTALQLYHWHCSTLHTVSLTSQRVCDTKEPRSEHPPRPITAHEQVHIHHAGTIKYN